MASSLALFSAMRGMQAGMAVGDAYKAKINAELQSAAIEGQMHEIDSRADIAVKGITEKGERVKAEQVGAFTKAGVKIEGSAMEVISDTMAEAAEAAMITRREADYDLIGKAMEKASLDSMASDMNFLLNSAAGLGMAYAGYQGDKFNYNRGSLRNRGASGVA